MTKTLPWPDASMIKTFLWPKKLTPSAQDIKDLNSLRRTLSPTVLYEWTRADFKAFLEQRVLFAVSILMHGGDKLEIVGMGSLYPRLLMTHGRHGLMEDIVVQEPFQGRGIGKRICTRLLFEAEKQALAYVELWSNDKRIAAHRLYRSLGFRKIGTRTLAGETSSLFRVNLHGL